MAICPQCGAEYRKEILRCEDCDRDLVEELTPENAIYDTSEARFVALKTFATSAEAEMVQEILTKNQVRSLLQGEASTDIFPSTAVSVVLLVDERDLAKASELVEAYFETELEEPLDGKEDQET
ncbi:MAG: DUF2007 domain-containing protein [Acidobacteriota bacterium]|nr:DUF2007 domain-containing protein [Blastocatellia bacterium]MDW8412525.1 DUF2007 domain-containing protein [Acidobacteriota bacterium]